MRKTLTLTLMLAFAFALAQNTGAVVNRYLTLRAYPSTVVVSQSDRANWSSNTVFTSVADIDTIYGYYHNELIAQGWTRSNLNTAGGRYTAGYSRGGVNFSLQLGRDASNNYLFDIAFADNEKGGGNGNGDTDNDDDDDDDDNDNGDNGDNGSGEK